MRPYHHGNLREALVAAAVDLGRERGCESVVIREVARRVGVSHAAAYRHFKDREELLRAVAQAGLLQLSEAIEGLRRSARSSDAVERARLRLRATGRAYVEFALAEPGLFSVIFNRSELADLATPFGELGDVLDECVEAGFIRSDKREGAELTCWAGVHGFATLYGSGPLGGPDDAADRAARLDILLDRIEDSLRA